MPSTAEPIEIECPECGGAGCCTACKDTGRLRICDCPQLDLGDFAELAQYADLYEKGLPPVAGGALDQAHAFTSGCRFFWGEQARIKAELGHWE